MKALDPSPIAAAFRDAVRREISDEKLSINIVGILASDDPASATYADYTRAGCEDVGISFDLRKTSPESVRNMLESANADSDVHGIFVYYPIWGDSRDAELRDLISPHKDVEGLCPHWISKLYANERFDDEARKFKAILPCTPLAILKLLEETEAYIPYGLPFGGQQITIFNRSEVVGRPLAYMLSNDGARVYSFDIDGGFVVDVNDPGHERVPVTREEALRQSDIVITGVPSKVFDKIKADELKSGAVCLNFSSIQNFEPDAKESAGLYIPRVGPMTVAMCMRNALQLYRNYHHEA
ncbi:tetrahydrofolate dehydrogenase/cyclohydrolase [Chlorobaculum parvum NCIB 8327]|uniref:Tetrahydrofolate dehydrogenase/cyclohydrolase n=1 Tax=Chlorobaculum parvum (strain DSM 263 / NCIMB 8327) TaxID=517417 RepID=B3QMF3_CHLP8|nr:bifunctional methylenetetrahydrofolate dehydrogenase/methenyltetrahydrofolate cyclohydrolase [Chlorobaculum parvum]ACF11106.1 tetrahydrofolate dehydrogenase/cyclohydrolase [Chlorobaculum parvum NCIB 8327]